MTGVSIEKALERSLRVSRIIRRVGNLLILAAGLAEGQEGDIDKALDNVEDGLAGAEAMLQARVQRAKGGPR